MSGKKPRIGLALGSGAARGLAHIPVLEVLEKENIAIDMIVGTSIGSLVGGVYAAGMPVKYMKEIAREIDWDFISDVTFPRKGLIKGDKLLAFLEIITQKKDIEDLKIPFSAIACDIEKGEHIILNKGSLARAIRASTSIPGIYVPFYHQGRLLVDGGVLDPVPVSTVRKMGADIVIAVDVGVKNVSYTANTIFDILFNTFDIIQRELENYRELQADIIIKPDLTGTNTFDLHNYEKYFTAGYEAIYNALPEIKEIIKERS
ncbi:MAG TPA: patatin family protein [Halanaerobiaceae bacterium]|jgi:NTE family protein|nr:patatin-like phospholipase family protein [Bacillota bacterium]HHU93050.1 patatin family protein [Halanaerobiaceae bacterium]HOA40241.1 patatin-like phospholipase family protein [Halanaerobiales bacterium]HPZ62394.1 patatin-like phospholipase family protein [Halanaerobiales bacterium]HQD03792.1 patatin-like phospholipase family protein [Halanaerobiales bacterium]